MSASLNCNDWSHVWLVCGAPGSGKTSFSCALKRVIDVHVGPSSLLSFDDVEVPRVEWDGDSFKESRKKGLDAITSLLDQNKPPTSIVVDDIMYLTSMRHEVYKLCRDRLVPLVVVHLNVSLEECLASNRERSVDKQIDEEAIERIFSRFESPQTSSICDRLHYTLEGRPLDNERSALDVMQKMRERVVERRNQLVREKLQATATNETAAAPESSGAAFDRRVRGAVSALMSMSGMEGGALPKPALAKILSEAKAVGQTKCRGGAALDEGLAAFMGHVRGAAPGQAGDKLLPALEKALKEKEGVEHV